MRKLVTLLLGIFLAGLVGSNFGGKKVLAQAAESENFRTVASAIASVDENGLTKITEKIAITNLTATRYTDSYTLRVQSDQVTEVIVNEKEMKAQTSVENGETIIRITFNENLVGERKTREFDLTYSLPKAAVVSEGTMLVTIPNLTSDDGVRLSEIKVQTPTKFGQPAKTQPEAAQIIPSSSVIETTFNQPDQKLVLLFGGEINYRLMAHYLFHNWHNNTTQMEVVLPSDKTGQKVVLTSIDPVPEKIFTDNRGKWVMSYLVKPQSGLDVFWTAELKISLLDLINDQNIDLTKGNTDLETAIILANQEIKEQAGDSLVGIEIANIGATNTENNSKETESSSDQQASMMNNFDFQVAGNDNFLMNLLGQKKLIVRNLTGQAWYNLEVNLTISDGENETKVLFNKEPITKILPWQSFELNFSVSDINNENWQWKRWQKNYQLKAELFDHENFIGGKDLEFEVTSTRLAIMASGFIAAAAITGSILVFRFFKKHTVRR